MCSNIIRIKYNYVNYTCMTQSKRELNNRFISIRDIYIA